MFHSFMENQDGWNQMHNALKIRPGPQCHLRSPVYPQVDAVSITPPYPNFDTVCDWQLSARNPVSGHAIIGRDA